ncbi:uncharacterized protein LOC126183504 [Schistocerca cancellata]|uniref:uncharacterized protein LOC126183504 n=1 Tax=Schistocerca cancellata TaxID=274614 RepID=UPI002119A8CA|nr:uncharacterized protein LOC126183504 [Schistocerca cancellata]
MDTNVDTRMRTCLARLLVLLCTLHSGRAACYFPVELQGKYVMQSTATSSVQYSQVDITADAIPIWGHCHRRIGNNVILMDESGAASCIRCFHVRLRSRNVLQVHTEGLDKCYTSEHVAEAKCPNEATLHMQEPSKEILLYKSHDSGGEPIRPEYCPINGRFTFTYSGVGGECPVPVSELDNCPSGASLSLRFRRCSFPDYNVTYDCLGHWEGPANQRYLSLLHASAADHQPRYRCALFREETEGSVLLAFSSDSTCRSELRSAAAGHEMLRLAPVRPPAWPASARAAPCRFPTWAQGRWQQLMVEGSTVSYRDHTRLQTYTMRCLAEPTSVLPDRFPVFVRTHCGEEMYNCIWMKLRGMNVLEFQLGDQTYAAANHNLCSDSNFRNRTWITQGRLDRMQETPCPIAGKYTGLIPDAVGLCAKLSSDCNSPDIMYYTVSDCTQSEIYEEREYRCLGQWEEDGLMYTYTQRRDVEAYECFVGSIVSEDEIFIKEAGEHCQRNVDPLQHGMKLSKMGSCSPSEVNHPQNTHTTTSWLSIRPSTEMTKPWKPITAPPRVPGRETKSASSVTTPKGFAIFLLILFTLGQCCVL